MIFGELFHSSHDKKKCYLQITIQHFYLINMQATGTSHIGSESTNNSIDDDGHDAEDLGGTH